MCTGGCGCLDAAEGYAIQCPCGRWLVVCVRHYRGHKYCGKACAQKYGRCRADRAQARFLSTLKGRQCRARAAAAYRDRKARGKAARPRHRPARWSAGRDEGGAVSVATASGPEAESAAAEGEPVGDDAEGGAASECGSLGVAESAIALSAGEGRGLIEGDSPGPAAALRGEGYRPTVAESVGGSAAGEPVLDLGVGPSEVWGDVKVAFPASVSTPGSAAGRAVLHAVGAPVFEAVLSPWMQRSSERKKVIDRTSPRVQPQREHPPPREGACVVCHCQCRVIARFPEAPS